MQGQGTGADAGGPGRTGKAEESQRRRERGAMAPAPPQIHSQSLKCTRHPGDSRRSAQQDPPAPATCAGRPPHGTLDPVGRERPAAVPTRPAPEQYSPPTCLPPPTPSNVGEAGVAPALVVEKTQTQDVTAGRLAGSPPSCHPGMPAGPHQHRCLGERPCWHLWEPQGKERGRPTLPACRPKTHNCSSNPPGSGETRPARWGPGSKEPLPTRGIQGATGEDTATFP